MNYISIRKLKDKPFFSIHQVSEVLNIKPSSAKVLCSRYAQNGIMIRLKRNFYILREKWENLSFDEFYYITNILQIPSYISFMTALNYYNITTQVQRAYFESACIKRTNNFTIENKIFNYYKLQKKLYFGFERKDNFFIATKEKSFIDCLYLYSFGKYAFDISSIELDKLDPDEIEKMIKIYPEKTQKTFVKLYGRFNSTGKV